MNYISTRNKQKPLSFSEAMKTGLAEDGGLFVPEEFPLTYHENLQTDVASFATEILKPYFKGDLLESELERICARAFNFPIPIKPLSETVDVLELFHGPTLAFKDVGARFLAECFSHQKSEHTILVATSGDTGSAVASAFYKKNNVRVVVLFPKNKISERQEKQIVCWGENILPLAVSGVFDDCQKLVKLAFADSWWKEHSTLSTANSINIGRLLPQMVYYAYTSFIRYKTVNKETNFIVPSGNVGNVTACFWAKKMGFPIGKVRISTNANQTLSDYLKTETYLPKPSIETLANAMDVGNPSNIERLNHLFGDIKELKRHLTVQSVADRDIQETIKEVYQLYQYEICPHTATAFHIKQKDTHEVIVSTADPCKFEDVVEPLIDKKVEIKPQLLHMLETTRKAHTIDASMESLISEYSGYFGLK